MKAFQDFYLTVGLPDAMRVTLPKCVLPRGQGCTMTLLETHLGSSQVELEQQALAPQLPSCPDSRPSWPCTSPTPILHGTSP
ncbi:hypothetical protein Cadr_000016494 [Camelus dromedarius]|uniref:Uncharacterized protein n=1 Tax=Camelus dromedarius TaxID=9838 RepID=A0A5N4E9H4_CAMDR|nr:hypothetical protein Cadr_000016494 [Camelus dromedarius]